jgi:hypothetical protein
MLNLSAEVGSLSAFSMNSSSRGFKSSQSAFISVLEDTDRDDKMYFCSNYKRSARLICKLHLQACLRV